ncbi:MAG: hypothetical protein AAFY24_26200 [Pseudomonadota bacterium]
MSLYKFIEIIEESGKGAQSYQECLREARRQLSASSQNAASYFILASVAEKFVDTFYDQPLLSQTADEQYDNFKDYVIRLSKAEETGDASIILDALNKVSYDVEKNKRR